MPFEQALPDHVRPSRARSRSVETVPRWVCGISPLRMPSSISAPAWRRSRAKPPRDNRSRDRGKRGPSDTIRRMMSPRRGVCDLPEEGRASFHFTTASLPSPPGSWPPKCRLSIGTIAVRTTPRDIDSRVLDVQRNRALATPRACDVVDPVCRKAARQRTSVEPRRPRWPAPLACARSLDPPAQGGAPDGCLRAGFL